MMERMKRGGWCFVGNNMYAKTNNKSSPHSIPNAQSKYTLDEDAYNLYGWCMSEHLPYQNPNVGTGSITYDIKFRRLL